MKSKRKLLLFNSLCAFGMIAVVGAGVGVWALTTQDTRIDSNVLYTASRVSSNLGIIVQDGSVNSENCEIIKSATVNSENCFNQEITLAMFQDDDENQNGSFPINIELQSKDSNAVIPEGENFTISFVIAPTENPKKIILPVFYKITYAPTENNIFENLQYKIDNGDYVTYNENIISSVGVTTQTIVTLKFTLANDVVKAIDVNVGTINVDLASSLDMYVI